MRGLDGSPGRLQCSRARHGTARQSFPAHVKNAPDPIEMFLLIDNYDSFTYNLRHYLGELGADVEVRRNDALTQIGRAHV